MLKHGKGEVYFPNKKIFTIINAEKRIIF